MDHDISDNEMGLRSRLRRFSASLEAVDTVGEARAVTIRMYVVAAIVCLLVETVVSWAHGLRELPLYTAGLALLLLAARPFLSRSNAVGAITRAVTVLLTMAMFFLGYLSIIGLSRFEYLVWMFVAIPVTFILQGLVRGSVWLVAAVALFSAHYLFIDQRLPSDYFRESILAFTAAYTFFALSELLQGNLRGRLYQANKRLAELATTDELTGLANRRTILRRLGRELTRRDRFGHDVSVIILDLDYFKNINDKLGHSIGDDVLRTAASVLRKQVRSIDTVSRWGGEEFLGLLPETSLDKAAQIATRLRAALEAEVVTELGAVTGSVGVAAARPGEQRQDVIRRADAALYLAKESGRNCVRVSEGTDAHVLVSQT